MRVKFVECTNTVGDRNFNWGKFALMQWDEEWGVTSRIATDDVLGEEWAPNLLTSQGWGPDHYFVMDLATGEGAWFRPGGVVRADLEKHRIWVCPLFEPFLEWWYAQPPALRQLEALPDVVDLPAAPASLSGYRRAGDAGDLQHRALLAAAQSALEEFETLLDGHVDDTSDPMVRMRIGELKEALDVWTFRADAEAEPRPGATDPVGQD